MKNNGEKGLITAGASGAVLITIGVLVTKAVNWAINRKLQDISGDYNSSTNSYTSLTKAMRVEPFVILDNDAVYVEDIEQIMQSLQSIFSGYYLQSVSVMGSVTNVQVLNTLSTLNPDFKIPAVSFDPTKFGSGNSGITIESNDDACREIKSAYKYRIPTYTIELEEPDRLPLKMATESSGPNVSRNVSITDIERIGEVSNLSVGKLINVSITDTVHSRAEDEKDKKITIDLPIAIRLLAFEVPARILKNIISAKAMDKKFTERWYKWRAGRITFIKDLVLCHDLIKEYKKNLKIDKDNVLTMISQRARKSNISNLITNKPHYGAATNMFVITEKTVKDLEIEEGVRIKDFASRQNAMSASNALIITVIDRENDRVHFYHRDIKLPTSVSIKDIKIANKGKGPAVEDILAAFAKGVAPSI